MDGSVVAVAVPAVAPGVAAVLTAGVATAVAAAAHASAGAAAGREEPVSKGGDVGCVGRSAVGVGDRGGVGLAVGGTLRGAAGGGGWLREWRKGKSGCHKGLKARPRQGWWGVQRW